ncbi:MAG: hypothetical protein KDA41_19500 [Planctomycetales bacterium]|nr:hypothetical protein [Planctomycetales bacterium]
MKRRCVIALAALVAVVFVAGGGCAPADPALNTRYGQRGGGSVNGLAALGHLFEQAGCRVSSRSGSVAGATNFDVVVWAPDRFEPPTEAERNVIGQWLAEVEGRTFIYIGRDYDAALDYWRLAQTSAAPGEADEVARRRADAQSLADALRQDIPFDADCDWFVVQRDHPRTRPPALRGPWSEGIDAQAAAVQLQSRWFVPDAAEVDETQYEEDYDEERFDYYDGDYEHEVLLAAAADAADDDPFDEEGGIDRVSGAPLAMRINHYLWGESQLIVVANGSFLLNLPLVNHEHRKLASRLVDECGQVDRVAFWEGSAYAKAVEEFNPWSMLTTWPLNVVLLQAALLGIVYVLWKFPIFGVPYRLRSSSTSDFGKHVDAVGELLAATGDAAYARNRVEAYRQAVRPDGREAREAGPARPPA